MATPLYVNTRGVQCHADGTPMARPDLDGPDPCCTPNATRETMRLAAMGMPQLVQLALRGKLRGRHLGLAIGGAEKYNRMVADGDVASVEDQYERVRSGCSRCPHATRHGFTVMGFGRLKWYCGDPFTPDPAKGTCGCPTGTTTGRAAVKAGRMEHPAGRLLVASLACGAGRYGPVERATA